NAREALRLLDAARILCRALDLQEITRDCAARAAEHLGVDEHGLRPEERRLLAFLAAQDRPTGLRTIADSLDLDEKTVRTVYEPYLVRAGLIRRTMRGRLATPEARARFRPMASPDRGVRAIIERMVR
ncbi:MAG: Holliday junction branch migration DNA helicase RuvB, partial [Planctomycetes bacterium]|nr:Holliday junction branch migration DNA helicase RuvB [Planctomycetota bacterium]